MRSFRQSSPGWLLLLPALVIALWAPGSALAQDDEEDEEPGAFREYLNTRRNNAVAGVNGILTFPADPVMFAVDGDEVFDGWWAPAAHVTGFFAGVFQGTYRVVMGALDFAFFPIPKMPMLSPVQRYKVLTFVHDNE